jgi:hypothetical protein
MLGPRGLPAPFSWAPKYLVRLQGRIYGGFDAELGLLIGHWHTLTVKRIVSRGVAEAQRVYFCNLAVTTPRLRTDTDAPSAPAEAEIQIQFIPEHWGPKLETWLDTVIPSGKARLLCGEAIDVGYGQNDQYARTVLAATAQVEGLTELNLDAWGDVAGSAIMNSPRIGVQERRLRWCLD